MKKILLFYLSLSLAFIGGILLFIIGFYVAITIVPDRDPEGNVEMPTGQLLTGILLGIAGAIYILVICYRKFNKIN